MELAKQLLLTAQMLINLVVANPELPQDVKLNALNQAFASITTAQAELSKPVAQTVQQTAPVYTQPVLQTQSFSGIIPSMNKIKLLRQCVDTPDGLGCNVRVFYVNDSGNLIRNTGTTLTITSDGTGQFVNYASPSFVSVNGNELVMKVKTIGSKQYGQEVLYMQPNKTKPTFSVTDENGIEHFVESDE